MANFVIGCSLAVPASVIYLHKKSKTSALVGCITGSIVMTVLGTALNALYLIPTFVRMFPYIESIEAVVAMGTDVNPMITDLTTFAIFAVAPINIIKGVTVSVITILIYKPLRRFIKIQE